MAATTCVAAATPICAGIGGIGSSIFGSGATAALDSLSSWVATGSVWFLGQIGSAMGSTTTVDLGSPWFVERFRAVESLLAVVALPFVLLTVLSATLRQDLGILVRAVLIQLPLGMLLAGGAAELTSLGLAATDELCRAISSGTGGAVRSLAASLASSLTATAGGVSVPAFVLLLVGIIVASAGVLLWIELVLRSGAIYVAVAFLPLVLVAGVWPAVASWSRRLVETLAALVTSKLVVVLVLSLAAGALGTSKGRGLPALMTGTGMLLLAGFAPFTLLKLLPLFEASAAGHLEGLRQRGTRMVATGPHRRLVDTALAAAAPPMAMAAAAPDGMGRVATTLTEDPMATGARFRGDNGPADPPIRPTDDPPPTRPAPPSPASPPPVPPARPSPPAAAQAFEESTDDDVPPTWPGPAERAAPSAASAPPLPTMSTPPRRPPRLVIDHDEIGPFLRERRPTDD